MQLAACASHYTGKERDAETGLDNFRFRYMSSAQGRWMTPDVVNLTEARLVNPSNTLNKYVYGGNNPLKFVDPDGRDITLFYRPEGNAGHFWLAAYNQDTGGFAVRDFGPTNQASSTAMVTGQNVPGEAWEGRIPSLDELRRNYTSLTIQTNPEVTQQAIDFINSHPLDTYNLYNQNCTTTCSDILHQLFPDTRGDNPVKPATLWEQAYERWANQSMNARRLGAPAPPAKSRTGQDYGRPRYRMNTFSFIWMLLQTERSPMSPPQGFEATTDTNGTHVKVTCY
jgi:RHS repeat-associated protein